jgi:hypothetical protein
MRSASVERFRQFTSIAATVLEAPRGEMPEGRGGDGHFRAGRYRRRPGRASEHFAARVFPDRGAVRRTLTRLIRMQW